jgi:hypothetical protein
MASKFQAGDKVKVADKLPLKLRGFPAGGTGTIAEVQGEDYSIEFEDGRRVGWYPGAVLEAAEGNDG